MSEPATKEDVEQLRQEMKAEFRATNASVEGMRSQNSAEHGSFYSALQSLREGINWLRTKWERFTKP